jgi:hypothetical protein
MSLFVECKPDETLVFALGVARRDVEHAGNRTGVCAQVSRRNGTMGMIDEDPGAVLHSYMKGLVEKPVEHDIRVLDDLQRQNQLVVICPRFEDWLVKTAKHGGLNMTDFGFGSDNGNFLHREINHRLPNVERLVKALLSAKNPRILRLQSLIKTV